jgi:hypothetical protein
MYAALGAVAAFLLAFGGHAGIARADVTFVPSIPSKIGSLSTGVVVLICIVAIVAVVIGVFFIRRARAKRHASGLGTGS